MGEILFLYSHLQKKILRDLSKSMIATAHCVGVLGRNPKMQYHSVLPFSSSKVYYFITSRSCIFYAELVLLVDQWSSGQADKICFFYWFI